ncbi:MAG: CHAP domain-containing protein [Armatimonadetes bacterium]|nr:CHAP domain-containing protein [Armatimonadota bacterium]
MDVRTLEPLLALLGGAGAPETGLFPLAGAAAARAGGNPLQQMDQLKQNFVVSEAALQLALIQILVGLLQNAPPGTPAVGTGDAGAAAATTDAASPAAVGGAGDVGAADPGAAGGGSAAVSQARQFLGQDSASLKGRLPKFTAAGGQTNNCCDFVSSCLENAGMIRGHFVNCKQLEQALKQQGWRQVPAAQAKPGDVWFNQSRGHVELVTAAGGTRTIGSNNDRPGHQRISERAKNPAEGVYYTKG